MSVFTALNTTIKQREFNITPYGENFISYLTQIKFKIWRVTFLKSFYHLKRLGSTSVFLATEDLPRVHCSETAFRNVLLHGSLLYEPPYDQTNKMTSAPSEDSDQPGHPPSLIRVFAVRMKKHWVLSYPL